MEFKYEISGRTFHQRPLVLGQVKQLIALLKGLVFPSNLNVQGMMLALGDKVPEAIAIVLTENGVPLKKKKLSEIQDVVEEGLDVEQTIKVLQDFFDCNPIASISEALIGLTKKVQTTMNQQAQPTSSTESVLSSPEETLPKETISSGDIQSENANPM